MENLRLKKSEGLAGDAICARYVVRVVVDIEEACSGFGLRMARTKSPIGDNKPKNIHVQYLPFNLAQR